MCFGDRINEREREREREREKDREREREGVITRANHKFKTEKIENS